MKNIVVLMNIDEFVCKTKEIGMKLEGMKNDVKNFILDQTHFSLNIFYIEDYSSLNSIKSSKK